MHGGIRYEFIKSVFTDLDPCAHDNNLFFFFGFRVLHFSSADWLADGDWLKYYTGWLYYRFEPFTWPITHISGLVSPIGTTATEIDLIPIAAIFFKALARIIPLPEHFQYFGLWLFLTYLLQGATAWFFLKACGVDEKSRVPGALLFVLAFTFVHRVWHFALTSHFLILSLLTVALRNAQTPISQRRFPCLACTAVTALSVAIHPYLFVMCFTLTLAIAWQSFDFTWRVPKQLSLLSAVVIFVLYLLGVFRFQKAGVMEYSSAQADLLTFFNSFGWSRWIPALRAPFGGYEGHAYLGLSGFALVIFYFVKRAEAQRRGILTFQPTLKIYRPLFVACLLMWFYALSARINFGGNLILDLRPVYDHLQPLPGIFRSSGRFVWPVFYLGLGGLICFLARVLSPQRNWQVLTALVVLHWFELSAHPPLEHIANLSSLRLPLSEQSFLAEGSFHQARVVPPWPPGMSCRSDGFAGEADRPFYLYAAEHHVPINIGYPGRFTLQKVNAACQALMTSVEFQEFEINMIYFVHPSYVHFFEVPDVVCQPGDSYFICKKF